MKTLYTQNETQQFKSLLDERLLSSNKILITSHKGPDDDSISSALALGQYIQKKYPQHEVRIVYASQQITRWSYFEGYSSIIFDVDPSDIDADLVIMTDASQWSRVSSNDAIPSKFEHNVIAIDHHKNNPDEGICAFIDSTACSCAELIYTLFYEESTISQRIAEVLLLGIIGDSGSFTYVQPSQTKIFLIAERLVREGNVDVQSMKATYQQYALATYKLMAFIMNRTVFETSEVWGTYSFSWLSKDEALLITNSDIEVKAAADIYINSYAKSVIGVNWGMLIYPSLANGNYNLTLRSLPNGINVRQLANELLSGGGHTLAAGGKFSSSESINDAISKVKSYLRVSSPSKP